MRMLSVASAASWMVALAVVGGLGGRAQTGFLTGTALGDAGEPLLGATYVVLWLGAWLFVPVILGAVMADLAWEQLLQR